MDYDVDLIADAILPETLPDSTRYVCTFINLDQNRLGWREQGLSIATVLADKGMPIVMIPDHLSDMGELKRHDWFFIGKPFSVDRLQAVVRKAVALSRTRPVWPKTHYS